MMTSDFFGKWLQLKKSKLSPTTFVSYADIVERFLNPAFGDMEIDTISAFDVELFLMGLLEAEFAPGTVKRVYSVFRSSMTKAAKLGLIHDNPTGSEKIDPLPSGRKEIEFFSAAEVQLILSALQREPLRWKCYGRMAIDSGCRRGELVGLQWQDLDGRICHVCRSAYKLANEAAATKTPKSGKARSVCLTSGTVDLLEQLRREQRKSCLRNGLSWNKRLFVFGRNGVMMHPHSPTKWWRGFLVANGLPVRPLHSLRHTMATLLLSHGVDIKTVSARLGHSSLEVTENYLHLVADADEKAALTMEQIL